VSSRIAERTAADPAGQPALTERAFARFRELIKQEAGISLVPEKRALLTGRLSRRVRDLGLPSFQAYLELVERDPEERVRMLDRITTNETHFFREPQHFAFLAEQVYPRWQAEADQGLRPRRLRVWSAACSTGEEPYSLAMSLLTAFPAGSGWDLSILASDLSTRVLERASEAVWPIEKAAEIPPGELRAFMLRGTGGQAGRMKAGPELRALVRFARLNLTTADVHGVGPFDLILCRNVLIYFDAPTKERVVQALLQRLVPGGHLFLGHAESLSGMAVQTRCLRPNIYVRAAAPQAPAPARSCG
jgi:chemotaxis protein methyltransferase CheR